MNVTWAQEFDREKNSVTVAGANMVIHCHHYNTHLLRNMEESGLVDTAQVIGRSVEKSIYHSINQYAAAHPEFANPQGKLAVAAEMSRSFGFGLVDLSQVAETGGTVWSDSSHFARGWVAKWGQRERPVCFFISGYVAGALAAAYDKPLGHYQVVEDECKAAGAPKCKFSVKEV